MATVFAEKDSGIYFLQLRFRGKRKKVSLGHKDKLKGEEIQLRANRILRNIDEGSFEFPADGDIVEFILSDGKQTKKPTHPEPETPAKPFTLGDLFDWYLANADLAETTLTTIRIHANHLSKFYGRETPVLDLAKLGVLQQYVDHRKNQVYRKRPITATTIEKEVDSIKSMWNWAWRRGAIPSSLVVSLNYPRFAAKAKFKPWDAIERQIRLGNLSEDEQKELWKWVYLRTEEIDDLLEFIRHTAKEPWIYPAMLFLADTGVRRSELLRCEIRHIDFEEGKHGEIEIQEKKRSPDHEVTTRTLPLTARLAECLKVFLEKDHSGGPFTFPVNPEKADAVRAKATDRTSRLLATEDYVNSVKKNIRDAFKRLLVGSKWDVIKGRCHVFRHSFISNLKKRGARADNIMKLSGHSTETMLDRYGHYYPEDLEMTIALLSSAS